MSGSHFNPLLLIEEVKKRPGLYNPEHPTDRLERLQLWKEIGAALFDSWETFNKGAMYQTVLQIQRKWRSLRDAYNRELRARRSGVRVHRRVYIYFKKMSFLGGFEGTLSDDEDTTAAMESTAQFTISGTRTSTRTGGRPRRRRKRVSNTSTDSEPPPDEIEMPMFNNVELHGDLESDTDRLFLLSFLPEMRQLPLNIKMWTRAQIASVMQEAVSCHLNNVQPGCGGGGAGAGGCSGGGVDVKQRRDSSD